MVAAGDTYRAGAIDQLRVWSTRAGAQFVGSTAGADPASVAFSAIDAADRARHRRRHHRHGRATAHAGRTDDGAAEGGHRDRQASSRRAARNAARARRHDRPERGRAGARVQRRRAVDGTRDHQARWHRARRHRRRRARGARRAREVRGRGEQADDLVPFDPHRSPRSCWRRSERARGGPGDRTNTGVGYLKGVGPYRAELLRKLGIVVARDLLFHVPHRYEDAPRSRRSRAQSREWTSRCSAP